jgi:hypothetical protein
MVDKIIKFNTKVIHNNNVYLKVSDVAKVFNMKMADFKQSHSDIIEKIPACADCILETEFNKLLSEDSSAMEKQGQLEITKIESLRAKTDAVISFQSFKMLLGRSMLQQLADMKGCKSIEEYITTYELPKEMNEALKEFIQMSESNTDYTEMVDYTFHKTEKFDIEKIRSFGLDVQVLTSIKSANNMDLDVFVVGKGIFYRITNYGDYEQWDNLYTDNNGNLILPFCDYDSKSSEEIKINLSQSGIDRDFREYTVIENMIWCIENLPVTEIEDYEYDVIGCDLETIKFSVSIELLIKMIRPDAVNTLFIDKVVDIDNECYLTDVKDMRVFAE